MDQNLLVGPDIVWSKRLIRLMDATDLKPKAALWVFDEDAEDWRLWFVTENEFHDDLDFFISFAQLVNENRNILGKFDASFVKRVDNKHPAILGLRKIAPFDGPEEIRMKHNMLHGYYLADAIILRMMP